MECYAKFREKDAKCQKCIYRKYCAESREPPLLVDSASGIPPESLVVAPRGKLRSGMEQPLYSRADMLELIAFMLAMDETTLDMLAEKLSDPGITLAKMGKKRNITRQAIHKFIKKRCEKIPELSVIFNQRTNNSKYQTFMEAVCQIKQQQALKIKSNKPNSPLESWNSLTSLMQSLDLSRMSIGKGGLI